LVARDRNSNGSREFIQELRVAQTFKGIAVGATMILRTSDMETKIFNTILPTLPSPLPSLVLSM
jgi:hypothetical protein